MRPIFGRMRARFTFLSRPKNSWLGDNEPLAPFFLSRWLSISLGLFCQFGCSEKMSQSLRVSTSHPSGKKEGKGFSEILCQISQQKTRKASPRRQRRGLNQQSRECLHSFRESKIRNTSQTPFISLLQTFD